MSQKLAPIVLFTYKRLVTLQKTVEALKRNYLASQSDLFIYSDGAKVPEDQIIIDDIRRYLKKINGFKSITIHESSMNKGLASSIIEGVSEVMKTYHKAIVLEDDLLTSTNFLSFMNQALEFYESKNQVYSISGYSFDLIESSINDLDGYFLNRSWSWGWATWKDRWQKIDWNVNDYQEFIKNRKRVADFSSLGSDVNKMLSAQMNGKTDSWYIRSTFHQFNIQGLAFYPTISKIDNNGFDQEATHNKGIKSRFITGFDRSEKIDFDFPDLIEIDLKRQKRFQRKLSLPIRILNKIKELFI